MRPFKISRHQVILIIYDALFFFFIFKMFFYMIFVGQFPDEIQHVSYIAYLEKTNAIIPDFKDMTVLTRQSSGGNPASISAKMGYSGTFRFGYSFNYLGHPPLYYQIMRLSGGVKVHKSTITVDILRLRSFNILLAAIAMFMMFYIGYTRLGNVPAIHLLYATICVSVPMLAYDCAGVNNDTLALLGITVFLLGLLRLSEKRYNPATFAIIGTGIAVTLLAKLVAGLAIAISIIIFIIFLVIKEKNLHGMFSKASLAAIPACLIALTYFLVVYRQTGSFQPTFRKLCPSQFYASSFYVLRTRRANLNFFQYTQFYWTAFMQTWTGIFSYVKFLKPGSVLSLARFGLAAIWVLPLPLLIQIRKKFHYPLAMTLLSLYAGLLITASIQFLRAYHEFKDISGYLGGYQSRYYLCLIPMLALAAVYAFGFLYDSRIALFHTDRGGHNAVLTGRQWIRRRRIVIAFCVIFTILLLYEDFIYFLIHFTAYV